MEDSVAEAIRLSRLAQAGQPEKALAQADAQLGNNPALGILYARAVALHCMGEHDAAAAAADTMLVIAAGQVASGGWQSIALSFRTSQHMLLNESKPESFILETTLQDLAQAEARLNSDEDVTDGIVLGIAHTGLGHGYHDLRLYELAQPHYEAALAASLAHSPEVAAMTAVTSQMNLAVLHLNWSGELHRIREVEQAREKSATAARHAALAQEYAHAAEAQAYAASAGLLAACADSSAPPEQVVERIREGLHAVEGQGFRESRPFALPFLAWALDRAGRLPEALEVATEACDAVEAQAKWLLSSAAHHTRAVLLARSGSEAARAALLYGDELAKTMWRERLRTLHTARSAQILERVTLERDRVQVLAFTDALTGVGNRRAFDARIAELRAGRATDSFEVSMIVVDVDRLKAVNDADGHEAGDLTLQAVARALSGQVRAGDLVARLGGDEFVAVLEGADRADAEALATRVIDAVSAAPAAKVTVSVGVATGPVSEVGSDLLRAADRAMYAAKTASRALMSDAEAEAPHPVRA